MMVAKIRKKSQQTKFSVRNNVKILFHKGMKEKAIFERLVKSSCGFKEAWTSVDLPNWYNQIYDLCRIQKADNTKDELVDLCNLQKALPSAFICAVKTAPELAIVVKDGQQLIVQKWPTVEGLTVDILKFCAMDHCWSIFGLDPIFNICSYNITVSTYRHPLLCNVNFNVHLVLLGATFVHSSKTFESYFSLPSILSRLKPELSNLRSFGTDGEKNLFETISIKQFTLEYIFVNQMNTMR